MSRPTYQQLEALADFLTKNTGIAKGLMRTAHGKHETKKKWADVAITINALGGAQKSGKGWAKFWADKKCALKKLCSKHSHTSKRTGGGSASEMPGLTPIDKRLAALISGPESASENSHVADNPSSSTSQHIKQETLIARISSCSEETIDNDTANTPKPQPIPVHSRQRRRPGTRAGKTILDEERARFAAIEARRVEAEVTSAKAFATIADNLSNYVKATECLAVAISESGVSISQSLERIANALQHK